MAIHPGGKSRDALSERSLLRNYRRGEAGALRLVESWIRAVVARTSWKLARERADLVQEVHLRILTNLRRGAFRGESSFKSYVFGVARYTSLGFVKHGRRYVELVPEELAAPQMGPEQSFLAEERSALLADAVRRMPGEQRRLFHLIYRQELDFETVGRELGIATGTVKSRASRFRATLARNVARGRSRPFPEPSFAQLPRSPATADRPGSRASS